MVVVRIEAWLLNMIGVVLIAGGLAPAAQAEPGNVRRLEEVDRPAATLAEWQSQSIAQAPVNTAATPIESIDLIPGADGFQLLLQTAAGRALTVSDRVDGNKLIFTIPNAQLAQPFERNNPVAGITKIAAATLESNVVQVTVTGVDEAPFAKVVKTAQGLTLTVAVAEAEEEIVVTAQKRSERAQDVPISLTTFDQQQVQDGGIRTIQDIANRTPNFAAFSPSTARVFSFYSVRGLSNSNFLSQKDVIGYYVDDIPYESGAFLDFDLFDVDRIEVLRGPQSTLYGRNSQGGVINITTKKPTNKPEVRAVLSYGNQNTKELGLSLSDAIIPNVLRFRVAGSYRDTDGFFTNTFLNDDRVGAQRSLTGRGELLWTPNPNLDISFKIAANSNQDREGVYSSINASDPYKVQYNVPNGYLSGDSLSQAIKIAYRNPAFNLTSITTHNRSTQFGFGEGDYSPANIFTALYGLENDAWTQELRIQSPETAKNFKWLLGTYLNFSDVSIPGQGFGIIGTGLQNIVSDENQKGFAVFGQVDVKPIERLTLTAGLRYETNSGTVTRSTEFIPEGATSGFLSGVFTDEERSDSVVLPKVAVQYALNRDLQAYGSITRGYKPGGFNYRAETRGVLEFQPEKSWNYEVGLKSSLFDNKLTANFAYFISKVNDYQVISAGPDGIFRDVSNAKVNINGLELELLAKPATGIELNASLGYVSGKFDEYTNPLTGQNNNGNRVPYAPRVTYNVGAQYRSPGGIFARAELQGVGVTLFDDENTLRREPFALVNARVGYEAKNYGIYLFANNLFDTRYYNQSFVFPPPNVIASYGNRAAYGVQLKVNF
jgi:iron complex outermembrane recepter protein